MIRLAISISPSRVRESDRLHLAHVHADRIGRAAEFGIDEISALFGLRFDFPSSAAANGIVDISRSSAAGVRRRPGCPFR